MLSYVLAAPPHASVASCAFADTFLALSPISIRIVCLLQLLITGRVQEAAPVSAASQQPSRSALQHLDSNADAPSQASGPVPKRMKLASKNVRHLYTGSSTGPPFSAQVSQTQAQ